MTDPRLRAAAEWIERLDGGEDAPAGFAAWRSEPGNEDAWQAVARARDDGIALADHPELLGLRHATLARVMRDRRRRPIWLKSGIAAAACVALAVPLALRNGWRDLPAHRPVVYQTDRGQRLIATLPDGSRLTLDTASRVRLAYTGTERRLMLESGQALFEVAKHQPRPFVVVAGGQEIVAHGTRFDVRIDPAMLRVALVEGKISVAADRAPSVAMTPDDVMTVTADGLSVRHVPGQADAMASWSDGELVFDNETLADAAAEINRYGPAPITIADPKAARLRISGSFRTGETGPFLEALQLGFPVQIERHADGSVRVASRG